MVVDLAVSFVDTNELIVVDGWKSLRSKADLGYPISETRTILP